MGWWWYSLSGNFAGSGNFAVKYVTVVKNIQEELKLYCLRQRSYGKAVKILYGRFLGTFKARCLDSTCPNLLLQDSRSALT